MSAAPLQDLDAITVVWSVVAVLGGLLFGELAGRLVRTAVGRSGGAGPRSDRATAARLAGSAVFWLSTAAGLVVAAGILDPELLGSVGDRLREVAPRLLLAGVTLIVGWVLAVALAAAVGQSARRATGVRQEALERVLRAGTLLVAVVLALAQLGLPGGAVVALSVVLVGAPVLAVALLTVAGGREVAAELAAGRALRHQLRVGDRLTAPPTSTATTGAGSGAAAATAGTVVCLHATSVELVDDEGRRHHLPYRRLLADGFDTDRDR